MHATVYQMTWLFHWNSSNFEKNLWPFPHRENSQDHTPRTEALSAASYLRPCPHHSSSACLSRFQNTAGCKSRGQESQSQSHTRGHCLATYCKRTNAEYKLDWLYHPGNILMWDVWHRTLIRLKSRQNHWSNIVTVLSASNTNAVVCY